MGNEFLQDYNDYLFVEQERDKIALEVVSAFKPQLARLPSDSRYSQFLRSRGLYVGPYSDTPEDQREKFARVAQNTHAQVGPRYTAGLFGPVVFVPGMLKHAWNSSAADINGAIAGMNSKDIKTYKENSHHLERTAWKVSAAIDSRDLNYALTAIYGDEWTGYDPRKDIGNEKSRDKDI